MCISRNSRDIKTAASDITVYKVMAFSKGKHYNLFRRADGIELPLAASKTHTTFNSAEDISNTSAYNFDSGFGYSCFQDILAAKEFLILVGQHLKDNNLWSFSRIISAKTELVICKFFIPQGSRYVIGKIEYGYVGEGLQAIRTEQLIFQSSAKKQPKESWHPRWLTPERD